MPTDMSFALSAKQGRLEWGSSSLGSFFGSLTNVMSRWWLRLVFDIVRFNFFAIDILSENSNRPYRPMSTQVDIDKNKEHLDDVSSARLESIGDYLKRHRYSSQFMNYYVIPMVAAPWCIDPDEFSKSFPAATLIDFMYVRRRCENRSQILPFFFFFRFQCKLLDTMFYRLSWRTIVNGSKAYVDAFRLSLSPHQHVHLGVPANVIHNDGLISMGFADGTTETFDHVVLSVHANQALRLLGECASDAERDVLKHFYTTKNTCIIHSDESVSCPVYTRAKQERSSEVLRLTEDGSSSLGAAQLALPGIALLPTAPAAIALPNTSHQAQVQPSASL